MTSIQLPPLQFDDGGFRVSLITGSSGSNRLSTSDTKPLADIETKVEQSPFESSFDSASEPDSENECRTPKPGASFNDALASQQTASRPESRSKSPSVATLSDKQPEEPSQPRSFFESRPGTPEEVEQANDELAEPELDSPVLTKQANDELEALVESLPNSPPRSPTSTLRSNDQATPKSQSTPKNATHPSATSPEFEPRSPSVYTYASSKRRPGPSEPRSPSVYTYASSKRRPGTAGTAGTADDPNSRSPSVYSQATARTKRRPGDHDPLPKFRPETLDLAIEAHAQPDSDHESGPGSPSIYSQATTRTKRVAHEDQDPLPDLMPRTLDVTKQASHQPSPVLERTPKSPYAAAQSPGKRSQERKFHAEIEATQIQNELGAVTEAMTAMRTKLRTQRQSNVNRYFPTWPESTIDSNSIESAIDNADAVSVQSVPATIQSVEPDSNVPAHPIESMQAAFVESLDEVTKNGIEKPKLAELDGPGRRERLLAQGKDDEPFDAVWRYRPGQKQHEVLKLISQISFGVYLLFNGMANDNSQVVSILQGHIDEVDEFLEIVLEDLSLASSDLNERIDCLKLPMAKVKVFEEMLEDRVYRAELLEGNEKIEQVEGRMQLMLKQWDDDVDAGLRGTTAFTEWLGSMKGGSWRATRPDLVDIYDAMKGNADGWLAAFDEINTRTKDLNNLLTRLKTLVYDIEKKAGEVSRRTWYSVAPYTSPTTASFRSKKAGSSISSPLSVQSEIQSATRASIRSGSVSHSLAGSDFTDSLGDFPLPGSAPLLPPSRSSMRVARKSQSMDAIKLHVDTSRKGTPVSENLPEVVPEEEQEDGPLYLLQPRTYTPQPPEPLPSPLVRDVSHSPKSSVSARQSSSSMRQSSISTRQSSGSIRQSNQTPPPSKSIRHRVSLKGSVPQDIRIPSSTSHNRSESRPSPALASPRISNNSSHLEVRDSTGSSFQQYRGSSGSEASFRQHAIPRAGSHADLRPVRPTLMQSPNSDYQHYHPVRASPHSPLQQRPHTAAGPQANRPSAYFPSNQPSRLGSMAPMENFSAKDNKTIRNTAPSVAPTSTTNKTLKKKKSGAFGWFKKAFTMDEEERAAFEARRAAAFPLEGTYYKDKDPKFLDGRRMR